MKIRNGFVSNSSSSSFVLKALDHTGEEFLKYHKRTTKSYPLAILKNLRESLSFQFEITKENLDKLKKSFKLVDIQTLLRRLDSIEHNLDYLNIESPKLKVFIKDLNERTKSLKNNIVNVNLEKISSFPAEYIEDFLKIKDKLYLEDIKLSKEIFYKSVFDYTESELENSFKYFEEQKHIEIVSKETT